MFNLDQVIADWRRQMAAGGIKSTHVLDELESHLRDEIERQIHSGAKEQEAFQAAVALLGKAGPLRTEFSKLKASPGRQGFLKACYVSFAASAFLINAWTLLEYEISSLGRGLGFSAVLLICLYVARLPYLVRSLRSAAYCRLAKLVKVATILFCLFPLWALLEAEHMIHSGLGIVPTVVLWCVYAAVVMTAVAFGLDGRFRRPWGPGGPIPPPGPSGPPLPSTPPCPPEFGSGLPPVRRFAPVAREALEAAGEEASRLGHDFIGTEHVLLGLLKLAKGAFEHLLQKLELDRETARLEIERSVSAVPAYAGRAAIPFTPRARKALQFAAREAKKLNQPCIGAEHIFLGLLLEGGGVAGQVLRRLGIRIEKSREEVLRCTP